MTNQELQPRQIHKLEALLNAGFTFTTIERMEQHLAVEKNGFVALLDFSHDKVQVFSQVGYRMGEGIGMLIERRGEKAFVWKGQAISATPELLAKYEEFKAELNNLLGGDLSRAGNRKQ
jgi:hypothetical protein